MALGTLCRLQTVTSEHVDEHENQRTVRFIFALLLTQAMVGAASADVTQRSVWTWAFTTRQAPLVHLCLLALLEDMPESRTITANPASSGILLRS
jgi:hypothetical protein